MSYTYNNLSENETAFLRHMTMFGSDGYPVCKVGRKWIWNECFGIKGAPVAYKTKREAFQAVSNYINHLCDKTAGRI